LLNDIGKDIVVERQILKRFIIGSNEYLAFINATQLDFVAVSYNYSLNDFDLMKLLQEIVLV